MTGGNRSLISAYRGVICDLDGVVYRGSQAVPGAVASLNSVIADRVGVVFATNNASRSPAAVGDHLRQLGLRREGWSVVTSAQAAASYLAGRLAQETPVLAVGGPGVAQALTEAGLTPVSASDGSRLAGVAAVVQGAGQDVSWRDLAEVGYLAQAGAIWVATNLDSTVPTSRGRAPGNGAFVAAVRTTTSASPHVTGKPEAALFDLARSRLGTDAGDTIVVGDRLETDIEGARAAGLDSMFVLGGASSLGDLAFAAERLRPTYVAFDLCGLLTPGVQRLPEPSVVVRQAVDRQLLLQAVVSAAWAARDDGRALSPDPSMWEALERRLGVVVRGA